MSSTALVATAENFVPDVLEASKTLPVLVDFWADWCGPCKQLMPVLDRLAEEYAGRFTLAKVNTDEQQELAGQIGIRSLPTVALFKNGQVVDHFVGVVPEAQIRELLDRHVPAQAAAQPLSPLDTARALKRAGDFLGAAQRIEQEIAKEPDNVELRSELGELQVLSGNLDAGKEILKSLQAREPASSFVKRLAAVIEFSDVIAANPDIEKLKQRLATDSADAGARHALAVHRLLAGDYDAALEDWLQLMRTHRTFGDDLPRKSLVQAFEIIGSADPRVADARRSMARMLF
jgi:putative thioredoxin